MGMRIDVYSHGFEISKVKEIRDRSLIYAFTQPLIQQKLTKIRGKWAKVPDRVYASATKNRLKFRFHANQLKEFLETLEFKGWKEKEDYTIHYHTPKDEDFPIVGFDWKSDKQPRDNQLPVIEGVLSPGASKMVSAEPGFGKTLIALWIGKMLGRRSLYTFKGGYVARWIEAFEEYYDLRPGELYVVRGSASLVSLMNDALEGLTLPKIIVCTNRTMLDYLKDYNDTNGKSKTYPVEPGKLCEVLGIGYVVRDEVHQEFHLNYKLDLFTHTLKLVALSGTLESTDMFMEKIYDIAYPLIDRLAGEKIPPYINVTSLRYVFSDISRVKYMGPMGYSHNSLEATLLLPKNKDMLENYLDIFVWATRVMFDSVMEPGQKMIHFCSKVEMCIAVRDKLAKMFPYYTVRKYTEEDSYDTMLEADIITSTVLSAGTAVDIPGLLTTFMSIAIDSVKSNKQALGRTRQFPGRPDLHPTFAYLVCEQIQKHMDYDANKRGYFRGRVLSHVPRHCPIKV